MTEMLSNRHAYGQALLSLGERRPEVVVLEADLGRSTQSLLFGERFPERYFSMGIAEGNMMGTAAGLSASGWIPYASTFCVFASMRAVEQIRNSIAYARFNVKIVATNAGIEIGADGVTHQGIEDVAIMRAIPNMTVLVPSDPILTDKLVHKVADLDGPVYIRLGRQPTPFLYHQDLSPEIGKAIVVHEGEDVTIIAVGNMVCRALEAAEMLAEEGVSVRVLDMHTVKPIDVDAILAAATETGCIVTAEDHNVMGGLGGAVAEVLSIHEPTPLEIIGLQDTFAESGEAEELLKKYGLTVSDIVATVKRVMARRDQPSNV